MNYLLTRKNGVSITTHPHDPLPDGDYIVSIHPIKPQSDIKTYRRVYFAKITFLAKEVGETKFAMHDMVKDGLLNGGSTQELDEKNWILLFERLDLWAWDNYGIILP